VIPETPPSHSREIPATVPSGVENGVSYDAYCIECGERRQKVQWRGGAWICPTHYDRGHVEFVAREADDA
jgi:hypothetical protein